MEELFSIEQVKKFRDALNEEVGTEFYYCWGPAEISLWSKSLQLPCEETLTLAMMSIMNVTVDETKPLSHRERFSNYLLGTQIVGPTYHGMARLDNKTSTFRFWVKKGQPFKRPI